MYKFSGIYFLSKLSCIDVVQKTSHCTHIGSHDGESELKKNKKIILRQPGLLGLNFLLCGVQEEEKSPANLTFWHKHVQIIDRWPMADVHFQPWCSVGHW